MAVGKLRFTLRTLFIVLTISAMWLGYHTNDARRQRIAVEAIEAAGGRVRYDYQRTLANAKNGEAELPGPSWLRSVLGDDFFRHVVKVDWNGKKAFGAEELRHLRSLPRLDTLNLNFSGVNDSDLAEISKLPQLKKLHLEKCSGVTDAGLAHVSRLADLEYLSLLATECSDSGIEENIPKLTKLQYIDLAGVPITNDTATLLCQLSDLNFVHLGRVGHRAKFDLSGAVASIKSTLPTCTVNYWAPVSPEK